MSESEPNGWSIANLDAERVWDRRASIYAFVAGAVAALGEHEALSELALPDDDRQSSSVRWAAGALDGVLGHHVPAEGERLRAKQIVKALRDLLESAQPERLAHLTRLLTRAPVLGVLDDVLAELVSGGELDPERFHELAAFLLDHAPDREVVKLAVSMLGVLVGCDERERLLTIGRHEEFTLFAAVAVAGTLPEPDPTLWRLAQGVRGWGRIHVVERLAETEDPDIRSWMLREGFRNEIMDEYLAHTCAVAGDLAGALAADIVDDALLDGASGILAALLAGGPAEDIEDYDDAPRVVDAYLRHVVRRPLHRTLDLHHLLVAEQLREFLGPASEPLEDDETLRELGWTLELRAKVLELCDEIVARPGWAEQVRRQLDDDDPLRFHRADVAAQLLDIDAWPHHLARVRADPRHSPSWLRLVQTPDAARFTAVLELARELLPLDEIATGAAEELGLGTEFDVHDTLVAVIQGLADKPGAGLDLLDSALRSPVTRVRRGALRVLATWRAHPPEAGGHSEAVDALLARVAAAEPDSELRADMQRLLEVETPA